MSSGFPTTELLFVYGSLKRGLSNHPRLDGAVFQEEAKTVASYQLLQLGCYPALTQGTRAIRGEVYRVSLGLLAELDAFEGSDYHRTWISLIDRRRAYSYLIAEHALVRARRLDRDQWGPR